MGYQVLGIPTLTEDEEEGITKVSSRKVLIFRIIHRFSFENQNFFITLQPE
jgi:hypothetical protein